MRSRYVRFRRLPKLPERPSTRNDVATVVDSPQTTSHPGTFDDGTITSYGAAWRHTGITPRVNRYRGLRRSDSPQRDTVTRPTLIRWKEDDVEPLPSMAERSVGYREDGRLRPSPDASHRVRRERDEVGGALCRRLS